MFSYFFPRLLLRLIIACFLLMHASCTSSFACALKKHWRAFSPLFDVIPHRGSPQDGNTQTYRVRWVLQYTQVYLLFYDCKWCIFSSLLIGFAISSPTN